MSETKVVHCRKEKYDIYIGRPSKWGNPYSHLDDTLAEFKVKDRKEAIEKYEEYLLNNENLMKTLSELNGKILGCWCKTKDRYVECHGDILVDLCNIMTTDRITQISTIVKIYRNKKDDFIKNRKSKSFKSSSKALF